MVIGFVPENPQPEAAGPQSALDAPFYGLYADESH
jgi:hypothetical protein